MCNVYRVKVIINQIDGAMSKNASYEKTENVLAISDMAAKKKVENLLKWEIRDAIWNKSYCVSFPECELLVENVTY